MSLVCILLYWSSTGTVRLCQFYDHFLSLVKQELQERLNEEMSLMRSFITGQRSGVVPVGSYERSASELE
ncbi:TRIO and F-actin-binding protein isoform X1, partial [Tachysurus ichikawai]